MSFSRALTAAMALLGVAFAYPAAAPIDDVTILQYALTLEHLENVFYKEALQKFTLEQFEHAGYSANYYNDLKNIAHDEEQHVVLLEGAITAAGGTPVKACQYSFPYSDIRSFITLSSVLEGVGSGAYLGAAAKISNKDYLTVAGSILTTEALHTSLQRLAIGEVPMANAYGTPLDFNSVYTLASAFITGCGKESTVLPFQVFSSLQVNKMACVCEEPICGDPGQFIKRSSKEGPKGWPVLSGWWDHKRTFSCQPISGLSEATFVAAADVPRGSYITFVAGLDIVSVEGWVAGKQATAEIPAQITGQTYVFITSKAANGSLVDADVLFGPAVLEVNPPPPSVDYSIQ